MTRFKKLADAMRLVALCLISSIWVIVAGDLQIHAQEIQVQVATEESPHYVGMPAIVQLSVEGLEAEPDPECTAETSSPDVRVSLLGISPKVVRRVYQSGGQIRRFQQVTHIIQFRVTASKPGEYEIGPFVISQGGTQKMVEAIKLSFQDVPTTDDMRIKLSLPKKAYPDQRVPVTIQWWLAGEGNNVNQLTIDAPLFDEFQFATDDPPKRGDSKLTIETAQGTVTLAATATRETIDDKEFTVITAQRTLIPTRPGNYQVDPITVTAGLVTKWESSPFGDLGIGGSLFEGAFGNRRRAAKVEFFRASGQPLDFEVKPFPSEGRPESFSGAVGNGYSLDVTADRTVIRAGDPIRLTLDLRGDGNLEGATLPPLSADGGLDSDRFRLPDGDIAGSWIEDQGAKQFVVSVRVLDQGVSEIPAIAYSWFDPETETYRTTRSKPIALRVMPAQVVGADAVVTKRSANSSKNDADQTSGDFANGDAIANANTRRPYTLSGADLAIEGDVNRLLSNSTSLLSNHSFQFAGYTLGSLCVVVALLDRRRRQIDPAVRRARGIINAQKDRILSASELPEKDAAKQISDALRNVIAEFPICDRDQYLALTAELDRIAYKPSVATTEKINRQWIDRALELLTDTPTETEVD